MKLDLGTGLLAGAVGLGAVLSLSHPKQVDQTIKHYTYGGPLAGLSAGLAIRLTSLHTKNPAVIAAAAGLSATLGSYVGDARRTRMPVPLLITTAGLTGAAALTSNILADRYVDKGYLALRSFLGKNAASVDQSLAKALSSAKALHPFFDSVISRAGLKGLLTVAAIPLAHQMVQRVITRKYRKADTFLHSSILGPLSPHPADVPRTDGPRYIPGTKVSGGTLTMDGDVYDHTDRVDLQRL